MYTYCLYACCVCIKEEIGIEKERREERVREREREGGGGGRLTSGVGGSSFWNVVAPIGGSSFLKQENIQLQTHHVELLNFLLLFPLIFTTEPADTLMLPARCVCAREKERERERVKERERVNDRAKRCAFYQYKSLIREVKYPLSTCLLTESSLISA